MSKVNLKFRSREKLGNLIPGHMFVRTHEDTLFEVVDLVRENIFADGSVPVLRNDVAYVVEVETGVVTIFPKNMEVEIVEVEVSEM